MANDNPLAKYSSDFETFCADIVCPVGGKFRKFGDVMDDRQRALVAKLAPVAQAVIKGDVPPIKRCYVSATKGYGKDLIATLFLLFVMLFAERPIRIQMIANKLQQANEPLDILKRILWASGRLNSLAGSVVEIQNYRVFTHRDTGRPESEIEVLASDRFAHGSRPDVLVCNEVSHIEDQEHFETANDNLAKCPHGVGLYLSNAGYLGTWQHVWHERVLADPLFDCTIINTPAPWIDRQVLAYKSATDIPSRHQMYFYGVWCPKLGDVLPRELITRQTKLEGPQRKNEHPYRYLAAADLSTTTNRSTICVFGVPPEGSIVLAAAASYRPQEYLEQPQFIRRIRGAIRGLHDRFNIELIGFDQHQSFLMVDICHKLGIGRYPYFASSHDFDEDVKNGSKKAEILFRAFQEGWVEIFPHEQLILDLQATSVVTKPGGPVLVFGRDEEGGHADLASSFSLGLLLAWDWAGSFTRNSRLYGNPEGPPQEVLYA